MNNELKAGNIVTCELKDGNSVVCKLVAINKRMATVELADGEVIKVGKTKVALFAENEAGMPNRSFTKGYLNNYEKVAAASGRESLDNGDPVAKALRGKDLEEVYHIAAEALQVSTTDLKIRYSHLNPGHQRMCVGNLLRRAV